MLLDYYQALIVACFLEESSYSQSSPWGGILPSLSSVQARSAPTSLQANSAASLIFLPVLFQYTSFAFSAFLLRKLLWSVLQYSLLFHNDFGTVVTNQHSTLDAEVFQLQNIIQGVHVTELAWLKKLVPLNFCLPSSGTVTDSLDFSVSHCAELTGLFYVLSTIIVIHSLVIMHLFLTFQFSLMSLLLTYY